MDILDKIRNVLEWFAEDNLLREVIDCITALRRDLELSRINRERAETEVRRLTEETERDKDIARALIQTSNGLTRTTDEVRRLTVLADQNKATAEHFQRQLNEASTHLFNVTGECETLRRENARLSLHDISYWMRETGLKAQEIHKLRRNIADMSAEMEAQVQEQAAEMIDAVQEIIQHSATIDSLNVDVAEYRERVRKLESVCAVSAFALDLLHNSLVPYVALEHTERASITAIAAALRRAYSNDSESAPVNPGQLWGAP